MSSDGVEIRSSDDPHDLYVNEWADLQAAAAIADPLAREQACLRIVYAIKRQAWHDATETVINALGGKR